jgi:hypothetical protein
MLLSGCDGGATPSRQDSPRAVATGEEEGEEALSEIPPEDRLAVVQIGAAAGNLRSVTALVMVQHRVRPRDTTTLRRVRENVRMLRPRDLLLEQLRVRTIKELTRAIRARRDPTTARESVRSTLAGVDEIVDGLRAYAFVHPEVQALVPE